MLSIICLSTSRSRTSPGQPPDKVRTKRKKAPIEDAFYRKNGDPTRTRTWDPMVKSHLLYRLSYRTESIILQCTMHNAQFSKCKMHNSQYTIVGSNSRRKRSSLCIVRYASCTS